MYYVIVFDWFFPPNINLTLATEKKGPLENFLFIWSFKFCRLLMEFLISLQN